MDQRTFETLDLGALVDLLARHAQTPMGRRRALAVSPTGNRVEIDRALDRTSECRDYLSESGSFGLSGIEDPDAAFAQLQIEATSLEPQQILLLERFMAVGGDLRIALTRAEVRERYPQLSSVAAHIPDLRRLHASIAGKILPNGEMDDRASPGLLRIRREMQDRRGRIHRSLESMMRAQSKAVQEEIVTFRNGRFVIPVRTEARGQIPGVVHGLSSSGQTSYVEPLALIDQNNDLVRLREDEQVEIARILLEITESLRACLPGLRSLALAIEEMDFAQAKAKLSAEFHCVRPLMHEERSLLLRDARHVLLERALRESGGRVVPISFEMDAGHPVMVISGPNAGGKTVVVKTIGLIALMAQMGLHVPAREAVLPVFDRVFADIGDQQSIAANLSTFTGHMRNISEMARNISPPALILIDEAGTGTDPDEGAALAVAIVDYFRRSGVTTIATTHYNPLKMWAAQTEEVLNASVEFDVQTLQPTYRLIVGVAGASSGLQIARRMGVPREILDEARQLLDPAHAQASAYLQRIKDLVDTQEDLRAALEEERKAVAEKYERIEAEFARREAERSARFANELERVIREFTAESQRLLADLNDPIAEARIKKQAESRAAGLRRSARALIEQDPVNVKSGSNKPRDAPSDESGKAEEIQERDRVFIKSLKREGIVESVRGVTVTVSVGSLKFRAAREELQLIAHASSTDSRPAPGVSVVTTGEKEFSPELKVIGMTSHEALERVDKFLDQAYLAEAESVRIVHGHGKGVLRRAIAEFLEQHPLADSFAPAPPQQGGSGATIVTLRKD